MREITLANTRRRGAPGAGAEMPLQPVVQAMVKLAVPLKPMKGHDTAEIHLQPLEDSIPEQVDARRRV